tara:strand:- start:1065 stop:2081 length:1017 start_codon:yes stop_codon:yes gene_type:complete
MIKRKTTEKVILFIIALFIIINYKYKMKDTKANVIEYIIHEECKGLRVDLAITKEIQLYSRSIIQRWIRDGRIFVDGSIVKPSELLLGGENILIYPESTINRDFIEPNDIKIDILYEDNDLIIVNKNKDMVVHPAAGHIDDTLANALVYRYGELSNLPRAGLIHRLDKDTTGILIVARNIESYTKLVNLLSNRLIKRNYIGFVHGKVENEGIIDQPINRDKFNRKKMSVTSNGKESRTDYKVINSYPCATKLLFTLHTGRTHQIRVHCEFLGNPIIGDKQYNRRDSNKKKMGFNIDFPRQALHAHHVSFIHPSKEKLVKFECPIPRDMESLEEELNEA